jgi:hypothetical protein
MLTFATSGVKTSHPFEKEKSPIMSRATNPAIESQ